jgi:hypothetical protein
MTRLQTEYQRLYLPLAARADSADAPGLIGAGGRVRALVLALSRPADWDALSPVWRGVQSDLELPAPAIAVNGVDAFELWFSLAEPVPVAEAAAFLQGLRQRYLADVKPARLRLWPDAAAPAESPGPSRIPALQPATGRWSAFVAPDLPAVFGDDPSLDFQPVDDAQAEQLHRLASIPPDAWQAALAQLQPVAPGAAVAAAAPAAVSTPASSAVTAHSALQGPYQDPRRFLLDVMNDPTVALVLRIDAAKALLPAASDAPR